MKTRMHVLLSTPRTVACYLVVTTGMALLAYPGCAATLEGQPQSLPEVQSKPEAAPRGDLQSVAGGNDWVSKVQSPDSVPVRFSGLFYADGPVCAALAGKEMWATNDTGSCNDECITPNGVAYLKLNQTYKFTLIGLEDVYSARGLLTVPSLNDLFASRNDSKQPARLYRIYIWSRDRAAWEKMCEYNEPAWNIDNCRAMEETFLIQVRPDFGARPVTRPGLRGLGGEDQADDAWTRDQVAIDASTAPGDEQPVQIGGSRLGDPTTLRFGWSVALGRLWSGSGAGRIHLSESRFSTNCQTTASLHYAARSNDTNEVTVIADLDDTNSFSQIRVPQAFVDTLPLYGSSLFTTNDFLALNTLVPKLTNHTDLLSEFLWTNFTTQAQQTLINTNSSQQQLKTTLTDQFNTIIQAGPVYETNRFASVTLSGRTRRLLLLNPSGEPLVRLNRFLLENGYPSELARLQSTLFDLKFYLPSDLASPDSLGFFTVAANATPFVIWRIGLPEGTTNQWRVQEMRNSTTNTTLLAYNPGSTLWTLTRGTGNDARIETRTITTNTVSGITRSLETQEVKNGAGVLSDRTAEAYQMLPWGYELVTVTNDPGGANLVTQFTYSGETDTNAATYGKLMGIEYPDGFWERRVYCETESWEFPYIEFGSLLQIVHPWKNSPTNAAPNDCLVTDYAYPLDQGYLPGSYKVQKWHDANNAVNCLAESDDYDPYLSRRCSAVFEEQTLFSSDPCPSTEGVIWELKQLGDLEHYGENQWTKTLGPYYGRTSGQLYSKEDDTGKLDAYDYEFGAWNPTNRTFTPASGGSYDRDVRQTVFHGVVQPGTPVYDELSSGPSGSNIEPVVLEPGRATKEARILQSGSLAAKELYVYRGNLTNFSLIEQVIYQRDCLGHATNVYRVDPATLQTRVIYTADWKGASTWPTDLKLSETDESGTVWTSTYDSLKRLQTRTKQPATGQTALVLTLSYDAANRVLTNTTTGGSLSQCTIMRFDPAGRLTNEISPQGLSTAYSFQDAGRQKTIVYSSGATQTIANYLDRRVASVTGSAVTNQFFDYYLSGMGILDALYPKNVTRVTLGSSNSLRWTATVTDHRYEPAEEQKPAFLTTNLLQKTFVFGAGTNVAMLLETGFLVELDPVAPHRFLTAFSYDSFGRPAGQCTDTQELPWPDPWRLDSRDRITLSTNFFEMDGQGYWFSVQEHWTYPYETNATATLAGRSRERLTGFTSTGVSETQQFDADTNQTTVKAFVDLANKKLTTTTSVAQSSLVATQIVVNGLLQTESTTSVAQPVTHYYDSLGREIARRDALGNLAGTRYDPVTGQVTATTNAQALVTTMQYYPAGGTNAGMLKCSTSPTGKTTYYNYNGRGQVTHIWGDVPYPEKRDYNDFGDQIALTTYRGGDQWTGSSWPANTGPTADVTHWYNDEATGLLTNKTDAASQSVKFDYYENRYPKSRIWARGVASTNLYTWNGDLVGIDYSDGTSVYFTNESTLYLNRLGKPALVIDATGTNSLRYDHAGRLLSQTCDNGLLTGITVSNRFHQVYGRDTLKVLGVSPTLTHSFGFDGYGRLGSVTAGIYWATYGYLANSDLLQTTTCKSNTTAVLTTTRTWETGPRLKSIVNAASGVPVTSHEYAYDSLDRRKSALLEDGSRWQYEYNDRNELTAGRRYWADWSPVAGQQFAYDFDNIGNRETAASGGDINGCNLRTTSYTVNALNEYTGISNPGYEDILGVALATNSVGVTNTLTSVGAYADRKGEYFHSELDIANGSGALWQTLAVGSGGSVSNGGFAFPGSSQTLTYDVDGNLTFDGIWTYQWDAENRLAAMTMTNINWVTNSNRLRLEFVYDYQGRRIQKKVSHWNSGSWALDSESRFVYDGWNLIATLNSQLSTLNCFMWGQDLSGTEDGAGGISGLLALFEVSGGQLIEAHFAAYDGNGNVTALVRAADRAPSARYEYSPFGESLRATGPLSKSNPFRFSTKFAETETGLIVYPKRVYSPLLGRWLSRDPAEEGNGENNLFAFVLNRPLGANDPLGTLTLVEESAVAGIEGTTGAEIANAAAKLWSFYKRVKNAVDAFDAVQEITMKLEFEGKLEAEDYVYMLASAASVMSGKGKRAVSPSQILGINDNKGKTVRDILKRKRGSVKNAPLPPGSPSWEQILNWRWEDLLKKAKQGIPGIKTFLKLLSQSEYDKDK